jgi:hypothetical protein
VAASAELRVEGLSEAMRALSKVSKETGAEAKGLIRDAAKSIQAGAQKRMRTRPGGGAYPRRKGMIRYSATNKGGAVGITSRGSRYPWGGGAEFGAKRAWVFGRVTTQGQLSRRQFPVWRGNQFVVRGRSGPGWLIQPEIRAQLPTIEQDLAAGLSELIDRELRKAGVKRG